MASLSARSVLITGANRGIGLEFVKQFLLLPNPPKHIFATCRNPDTSKELKELATGHPNVHIHRFDAVDYASYPTFVEMVDKTLNGDGLNMLINNAGIYGKPGDFASVSRETMLNDFEVNAVAPLRLSQAFHSLLKKAAAASNLQGLSCSKAAIINITSKMGSMDDNTSGGSYSYRASKAAQNMITKGLSVDLKADGIMTLALHPGWVVTDMGGKNALIDTTTCVTGLLKVMAEQKTEDSGKFLSYAGVLIPW